MKFPSKKDWWLTIIIWGAMLFAMGSGIYSLIFEESNFIDFVIVLILAVMLPVFLLWMWLTTYYVLDESNLVIKYGPFKKIIPLNTIKSVKKTMNPLSSPALSLKRLEIIYGQYNMVLISPKDRDEFMKILSKHCPQAEIRL
jgi:membrane protein YdbS with pleckstrin-like domain